MVVDMAFGYHFLLFFVAAFMRNACKLFLHLHKIRYVYDYFYLVLIYSNFSRVVSDSSVLNIIILLVCVILCVTLFVLKLLHGSPCGLIGITRCFL